MDDYNAVTPVRKQIAARLRQELTDRAEAGVEFLVDRAEKKDAKEEEEKAAKKEGKKKRVAEEAPAETPPTKKKKRPSHKRGMLAAHPLRKKKRRVAEEARAEAEEALARPGESSSDSFCRHFVSQRRFTSLCVPECAESC